MLDNNLTDKTISDILLEAETRLIFAIQKHDPIKHAKIHSALSVALEQIKYAIHLRDLVKKDPQIEIIQRLKEIPVKDWKSRQANDNNSPEEFS